MVQKRRENTAYFDTISGYREKRSRGIRNNCSPIHNRIYSTLAKFR